MREVYEKIYDITCEHLNSEEKQLGFYKSTFVNLTENNPKEIDLLKLIDLDNKEFLEASYMAYFNRVPDSGALESWSKKFSLNKEEFQKQVTRRLVGSLEFKIKNTRVINNIYESSNVILLTIRDSKNINNIIHKLYLVYNVTLKPIKIKINKVIHAK